MPALLTPICEKRLMNREEKHCRVCGRRMVWRRKWRRNWDYVKYCSKTCRYKGLSEMDRTLEDVLVDLMVRHRDGRGIRPEKAIKAMATIPMPERRYDLSTATRNAARRLHSRGIVDILQNGRTVDPSYAKGPFRIRRRKAG